MVESVTLSERPWSCNLKLRSGQGANPARLIGTFNTWAYKRQQPSSIEKLSDAAEFAQRHSRPLPFVLYWGKGPRAAIRAPELQCLDFLAAMGQRVAGVHAPGAHFELLLTDTHAELNGHSNCEIQAYFNDVAAAAAARGFTTRRLSSVVSQANVALITSDFAPPSHDTLSGLEECAEKWYRGEGRPIDGAAAYYAMNMREKRAVEGCYPHAIFVTFNSSALRILFPEQMPIFYMYSLRKGCAIKPWFMGDEAAVVPPPTAGKYIVPALAAG